MSMVVEAASGICRHARLEQPESRVVAIAGSAGACAGMCEILSGPPADFPVPVLHLQHLNVSHLESLVAILQYRTALKVRCLRQGDRIRSGVVYLCPSGSSFIVGRDGTITLVPEMKYRAADHFFASVAANYGHRAVAVVLSGGGSDGAEGVCAVHARHGTVLVQDEGSACVSGMPKAAVATGCVDLILPVERIGPLLVDLVRDGHSLGDLCSNHAWL